MVILTKPSIPLRRPAAAIIAAAVLLAGCARPHVEPGEIDSQSLESLEFQAFLADQPLISVAEAYRAILLLVDREERFKTTEERQAELLSRGFIREAWKLEPHEAIDKGSVAYMLMKACQIKTGINNNILGRWGPGDRRYATREMIYYKIMTGTVDYESISGGEFMGALTKADAYMAEQGLYETTPMEFPPEPE